MLVSIVVFVVIYVKMDSGSDAAVTVTLTGTIRTAEGDSYPAEIYYCEGATCSGYDELLGSSSPGEGWEEYYAVVGFKDEDEGKTFLTEFSIGYTFVFDSAGALLECNKIASGAPDLSELSSTISGDASEGASLSIGGGSFDIDQVEASAEFKQGAQVFGLKVPTPVECGTAKMGASRRLKEERERFLSEDERRLASDGYDNWMLSYYTYKTHSGLPFDNAGGICFWCESQDEYDGWQVVSLPEITYTEEIVDLEFWTTLMGNVGISQPDKDTAYANAPKTYVEKTTTGKCEEKGSFAKVWQKGNDVVVGFAGTDVFALSLSLDDVGDILDDMNAYEVVHPNGQTYHAGFLEYTLRIDDCVKAILDNLPGTNLKHIVGHSLGGGATNVFTTLHTEAKYVPSSGVRTYGAPVNNIESCTVPGVRYFNVGDTVASRAMDNGILAGLVLFMGPNLEHNVENAVRVKEVTTCTKKWWGICVRSVTEKVTQPANTCEEPVTGTCSWVVDCFYNLALNHLNYGDWSY
jgi:hypothetical protein